MTEKYINLHDNKISVDIWPNHGAEVCSLKELIEAINTEGSNIYPRSTPHKKQSNTFLISYRSKRK